MSDEPPMRSTMGSTSIYDDAGSAYVAARRADPRIAAKIVAGLGDARTVVNVGAGTGSYEPSDRDVIAVEPSQAMIGERAAGSAPVVRGIAEHLPFRDGSFDVALASLTLHHWSDWRRGLDEMNRVAPRVVVFTFEPEEVGEFWLVERYFPEIAALDRERCPPVAEVAAHLGGCIVERISVPHDCTDGFLMAYWRRPAAYLDPRVRAAMSAFALLDHDVVARGIARLDADLRSGEWERQYGYLLGQQELDLCYRLLSSG